MPELPDLQNFSRNLSKLLRGKKLKTISVVNKKKLKTPEKKLREALEGQELEQVRREGKELRFDFKNGAVLGLHLMLRGQLHKFEKKNTNPHTIIEMLFTDDSGLAMTDFQGQANATLNPEISEVPDALSEAINYGFLKNGLAKKKAAIKNVLLDQHFIRGIGNAYVDEILWEARISPFSVANKIPDRDLKTLARKIRSVLTKGEKSISKTHPDIISGEVRDFLKIHNAKKTHSPTGAAIEIHKAGARKTYYTAEQELFE
jgi:formamidopyrimidine-DNA glycosylase